jgi:asparagine synthase (glutamine-hydrolysing)
MATNPGQAPAFARGFFGLDLDPADPAMSHRPRWNTTSRLRSLLTEDMRAESDREPAVDLGSSLPPESSCWDPLARAQWLEMTTLLPGYILASQGDRMLMANSVEGRFPFLDPHVVEYANALPARHKLFGLDEKFLLKHAFADLVPEQIRNRPKQPYRAPDALSFFTADAPDWVDDVTSRRALLAAGVFDPPLVAGLLKKARQRSDRFGNTDNMRVLAVLSTQLVQAELLDATAVPGDGGDPPQPLHVFDLVHDEREER